MPMNIISVNLSDFLRVISAAYQKDLEKVKQSYLVLKKSSGGNPENAAETAWTQRLPGWGQEQIPKIIIDNIASVYGPNAISTYDIFLEKFRYSAVAYGVTDAIPYLGQIGDGEFDKLVSKAYHHDPNTFVLSFYNEINKKIISLKLSKFYAPGSQIEKEFLEKKVDESPEIIKDILDWDKNLRKMTPVDIAKYASKIVLNYLRG